MIKNDDDYLKQRTYTNYGGVNMAFDLNDEELKATRIMNGTASKEELYERIAELEEIEKEHKKENGELREKVKELEKKNAIINKMSEMLVEDKEWFYSEFDNYSKEQFIEYFTNLVEKEDK